MDQHHKLVIWKFLDGRAGHENQVNGLADSIGRLISCDAYSVRPGTAAHGWRDWVPGLRSVLCRLPRPQLLIGAGHATHLPMLSCRIRFGGRTIVVMKPSLPLSLFDLCLIPNHDRLIGRPACVVRIEGALNRVRPSRGLEEQRGLLLIGGPSRHFRWSAEDLFPQIDAVLKRSAVTDWTVVTSERTPPEFACAIPARWPHLPLITPRQTTRDWLANHLSQCGTVWVTSDSMSMIYEAITAGAKLGLLEMRPQSGSRVAANVQRLLQHQKAVSWSQWMAGHPMPESAAGFSEADRCAMEVLRRCVDSRQAVVGTDHQPFPVSPSMNLNPLM